MTSDPIIPTLRVATETEAAKPDTSSAAPSASGGPGRMIRAARERASMSIEELAVQTRLARATLEALESDDFSTLHEAVYVRGYYRKCAKVLKLPEAELIGAYDKLLGPKAPPMPTKLLLGSDGSTMRSMSRRGGPSLLLVLVVAVAIGVAMWFLFHESPSQSSSSAPSIESTATPSTASGEAAPAPTSTPDARPGVAAGELATPTPGEAPGAAVSGTEPSAASAVGPAEPAVAGSGALVLDFNAMSWVRVDDADGRLLLSGTQQAGDHQVLRGRLPYALFVGYAPGVTVEFDGKPFDLKPHMRDNATARISLPYVEPAATPSAPPATAP